MALAGGRAFVLAVTAFSLAVAHANAACTDLGRIDYRLSLVVTVDGSAHTGTGVIETDWSNQSFVSRLAQGVPWVVHVRGEAVTVGLGTRGTLFVLLTGPPLKKAGDPAGGFYFPPDPERLLLNAFSDKTVGTMTPQALHALACQTKIIRLGPADLPMMVRFADESNPASVMPVDPRDLSASFGATVELRSATIAITDEPATTGLETRLDWLPRLAGKFLSGKSSATLGLPGSLPASAFTEGMH